MTGESCWAIAPLFLVGDVVAAAAYYRDVLGFHYERLWGDPPSFCMVKRGGIIIMLSQLNQPSEALKPNRVGDPDGDVWDAYVWVDDADALFEEFKSRGVVITRGLCDQVYGNRDFEIRDLNGYTLCFGHNLQG